MTELDHLLSAHRRDRRRAEAIDLLFILAAGIVLGGLYLCGVLP